jgi:hypothetical protein
MEEAQISNVAKNPKHDTPLNIIRPIVVCAFDGLKTMAIKSIGMAFDEGIFGAGIIESVQI